MADGPPPRRKSEPAKPTWTERSVPGSVDPATRPTPTLAEDHNMLVPAADPVVLAAYGRTGMLPTRPALHRGEGASDALVIQQVAKQTRVLNFRVEGVHWRAGFAPEIGHTPLSQYVQDQTPPDREIQGGNGFVMRPIELDLETVLRDIVPPPLLKLEDEMFGRHRELGGAYLYFIPHAQGATAGMAAWYLFTPTTRAHVLYLQTEIKRADVRILDEMHKTFRASLIAREQHGPTPRPFDFWDELAEATARVEATLRSSNLVKNDVQARVNEARHQAEDKIYRRLDQGLGKLSTFGTAVFVRMPQRALAGAVRVLSRGAVQAINAVDRMVAPKDGPPG